MTLGGDISAYEAGSFVVRSDILLIPRLRRCISTTTQAAG